MTIKEIALKLLQMYKNAQELVIEEYSGDIETELRVLNKNCDNWKKKIEEAE